MVCRILHIAEDGLFHLAKTALSSMVAMFGTVLIAVIFSTVVCRVCSGTVRHRLGYGRSGPGVTIAMVIDWCMKTMLIFRLYRSKKQAEFRVI